MSLGVGMTRRQPAGGQAPVVQRIRVQYAKRGPMRFTSHRDFARAVERALRRAQVPIAFSQGFTPHPRISYASAAPTGAASEAEYLELGLQAPVEPTALVTALDAALPSGLDILAAVVATPGTSLADRMQASHWLIELPEVDPAALRHAVAAFESAGAVPVARVTKRGWRTFDARPAVMKIVQGRVEAPCRVTGAPCAILETVVRQATPSVRPDDVLAGLRVVAGLELPVPARAMRLAQGPVAADGGVTDPLEADQARHHRGASA